MASFAVDRYALSLYVCGNASQHHACLSWNTAKKCLHGICHLVQFLQKQGGILWVTARVKHVLYPIFPLCNECSFSSLIKCFMTAVQGSEGWLIWVFFARSVVQNHCTVYTIQQPSSLAVHCSVELLAETSLPKERRDQCWQSANSLFWHVNSTYPDREIPL